MSRVSITDLEYAADWLRAYEVGTDDSDVERNEAQLRVAAWLDAEVARRQEEIAMREIVARTGTSPAKARAALRRVRS